MQLPIKTSQVKLTVNYVMRIDLLAALEEFLGHGPGNRDSAMWAYNSAPTSASIIHDLCSDVQEYIADSEFNTEEIKGYEALAVCCALKIPAQELTVMHERLAENFLKMKSN